jgi:hypothetical protein
MTMRILLVLAAIVGFSGYASAQTAAPNSGKPLKRVTPSGETALAAARKALELLSLGLIMAGLKRPDP